jgi:hypothetical protein
LLATIIRSVEPKLRIVTRLPLQQLWRDDGFSTSTRGRTLNNEDIRQFLASGPVQFVVADVGVALRWIPASECFSFWKNEAGTHLVSGDRIVLDDFPGGYCYFASHWEGPESEAPIVVMERHH